MRINSIIAWDKSFKDNPKNQVMNSFLKREINSFLKYLNKSDKILDYGCGIGDKTEYISKKGFNIIGLYSSKSAIKYAKKNFSKFKFYVEDDRKTYFRNKEFDVILAIALLHCLLSSDRERVNKEISRILKKGGYLFLLVLSNKDTTKREGIEIEKNTFLGETGKYFHLFTKEEIKKDYRNYKFIRINHYMKKSKGKSLACFVCILRKK